MRYLIRDVIACFVMVLLGVILLLLGFFELAAAEEYPTRMVEVVVPYGPGSNTDRVALTIIPYLEKELGQKVLPNYKGGGGGAIGTAWVARAKPDGYTLGLNALGTILCKPLTVKLPYSMESFAPIAQVGVWYNVILGRENSKWKTIKELIADAKQNSDKYTCGITGPFGVGHFALEAINEAARIKVKYVPFEGGAGGLFIAVVGGQVDVVSTELRYEYGKDGNTRVLTILSGARLPEYPDVPIFKEYGYNLVLDTWVGLVAPRGTPQTVIEKVERAVKKITTLPEFQRALKDRTGVTTAFLGGNDWRAKWEQDSNLITGLLKNLPVGKEEFKK